MATQSKYTFVSTMNQKYFDRIGQYMLLSFFKYTNLNFEFHLYAEDIISNIPNNLSLKIFDWNVSCKHNWVEFCKKTTSSKDHKFAKKGFAFIHAMENANSEKLIWLDADILFLKMFDKKIIDSTILKNKLIGLFDHSYLKDTVGYSAESGYVILNCNHPEYKNFVTQYKEYYTGPNKPAEIETWWDGQVCMLAASKFADHVYNLSNLRTDNSHTPLNSSSLSEYFIHCKGKKTKQLEEVRIQKKAGL
tara:strand:+ start:633 stop:1376 length:744 start_codon:yes stop_codon:yes gene_type:complete